MMKPWENGKNPNFVPSLGPPKFFPWALPLVVAKQCYKLPSYAISSKTNGPNLKKWQKPNFGSDFGPFGRNLGHQLFFAGFTSTAN